MSASNSITRFSSRVADYQRSRPSYPAGAIDYLLAKTGLRAGQAVADVGSGTGLFSSLLLDRGLQVVGIEPNARMREAAETALSGHGSFRSVDAAAEQTTLPDSSVDLVTAAQAFHWFDRDRCRLEFRRILRAPGWVALIWNERLTATTPFLRGYEQLLKAHATDYSAVDHRKITPEIIEAFFKPHPFEYRSFENRQSFDFEGLAGRARSSSYLPTEGDAGYDGMIAALQQLFESHRDAAGLVYFDYACNVYVGRVLV